MPARHRTPQSGPDALERSLHALPADRVTARAKTQIHIAAGYLELGEHEQAAATADKAMQAIGPLSSSRIVDRVEALRCRARQRKRDRHLAQFDEQIATFLAGRN